VCAVVEDRTVVAFTEVEVGPEPTASQHSTVVLPGHRRRGLGTAVKLALAARLRAARPDLTTVTTTVSAANAPMLALNERVGYRAVRTRLLLSLEGQLPQ
jgi:RimJ/RimL family protein N-acetyltransferase